MIWQDDLFALAQNANFPTRLPDTVFRTRPNMPQAVRNSKQESVLILICSKYPKRESCYMRDLNYIPTLYTTYKQKKKQQFGLFVTN